MDTGTEEYIRFLRGDDRGMEQIIRTYKDGLIWYLSSVVHSLTLAEELAEDTFVLLCTKRPKDRQKGSFRTWLYTIGRNLAISCLRRQSGKQTEQLPDDGIADPQTEGMEQVYLRTERKKALHRAMFRLKTEYRQVLWLIYFEDFRNADAAKVLRKSVHNTEVLVSRARKALKKELEQEDFEYENI